MNLQVQKKDGQLQPFDRNKVLGGLVKSGVSAEQAESIAIQVEAWVQVAAHNGVVQSLEIRAKVLELLKAVNPTVAASFEAYQKPQA
jgi:transcriptional regulator NrdR family protein